MPVSPPSSSFAYAAPVHFSGIRPPHSLDSYWIHPLKMDIGKREIDFLTQQIHEQRPIGEGLNGKVYASPSPFRGPEGDIVIKVHKGREAKFSQNDEKEVTRLDLLNDLWKEGKLGASQQGLVAFQQYGGLQHIVSTRVPGQNPHPEKNPITGQALHHCIKQLVKMDCGTIKRGRFLHNDINPGNVNFSRNKSGFYDWEHLSTLPLEEHILWVSKPEKPGQRPFHNYIHSGPILHDTSDTFPVKSNLKHFEARVIHRYLTELAQIGHYAQARQFFQQYLAEKAFYHQRMQAHYDLRSKEFAQIPELRELVKPLSEIANSEGTHARLLLGTNQHPSPTQPQSIPQDIVKAELYKMNLAYYAWHSRGTHKETFNGKQVGEWYDQGKSYFESNLEQAIQEKDRDRERYYRNCLMITDVLDDHLNTRRSVFYPLDKEQLKPAFTVKSVRMRNHQEPQQVDLIQALLEK